MATIDYAFTSKATTVTLSKRGVFAANHDMPLDGTRSTVSDTSNAADMESIVVEDSL